jgi:hypothetical protein
MAKMLIHNRLSSDRSFDGLISPLSLFPISKQVYRRTRLVEEEDGAPNPNFPALSERTDV